jgi:alkylation response protein AidB-like acyl-CoA dehydrogenase
MDFEYSETQQILRDTVTRYVRNEHSFEQRAAILAGGRQAVDKTWKAFAELGVAAIPVPEAHGGIDGGAHDIAVVMEAIGRGLLTLPYVPTVVLGSALVRALGNESQQSEMLTAIAAGERRVALAHSEPGMRYDLLPIATTVTHCSRRLSAGWQKSRRARRRCGRLFSLSPFSTEPRYGCSPCRRVRRG